MSVEKQFLPAALEIQQTPSSPMGSAVAWFIVLLFVVLLSWACLGEVDIVTVAQGKVIPTGQVKQIQPLETGKVKAILVKEGQRVSKGEKLIRLDDAELRAEKTKLHKELKQLDTRLGRKIHLLKWLDNGLADTDKDNEDPVLLSQWRLFAGRQQTLAAREQKIEAERLGVISRQQKLKALLPIHKRQMEDFKSLADKKMLASNQFLAVKEKFLQTKHDVKTLSAELKEKQQAKNVVVAERNYHLAEQREAWLKEKQELERNKDLVEQELEKVLARLENATLTSPVDGFVQQLNTHTVNGIVRPAEVVMKIVPENMQLEVEALVLNKDIGFVDEGQKAEIKLDAFPFTRYGTVEGKIDTLSDDAISHEQLGLVYKARVLLDTAVIKVKEKLVGLSPGMSVSVEIKTGSRRMIDFFLSPLMRYQDESLRER